MLRTSTSLGSKSDGAGAAALALLLLGAQLSSPRLPGNVFPFLTSSSPSVLLVPSSSVSESISITPAQGWHQSASRPLLRSAAILTASLAGTARSIPPSQSLLLPPSLLGRRSPRSAASRALPSAARRIASPRPFASPAPSVPPRCCY